MAETLSLGGGENVNTALAAQQGGLRRWQVRPDAKDAVLVDPSGGAGHVGTPLAAGTLLANQGCADKDGKILCAVQPLGGRKSGYVARGHLRPARGPDGIVPLGPNDSRRRAKRRAFDASLDAIPCAQIEGEALGACSVSVARSGGGDATVLATFGNNFQRQLFFVHGAFVGANATMSGVGNDVHWQIRRGVYHIRVDDQRFEIPVDFVLGTGPEG